MQKVWLSFRKRWKLILILLVIVGGGFGWWKYRQQKSQPQLEFIKPERGELVKTLDVSGSIMAKRHARLRFAGGGKVVYIGAKEGDAVKRWQTIATIDQSSLRKNLEKSLNNYSKERLDWEQTQDDTEDRWLPDDEQRDVKQNQLDLNNTVLDVEINDIAITNTVLSSPIDGVLISSPTNVSGVTLLATDVFEVVDPKSLIFRVNVDELDIGAVKEGQYAKVTLDSYPDEWMDSSINYISYTNNQSATGNTYVVDVPLADISELGKYRIGMGGDVSIEIERRQDVISVPLDTTIERDGKTYVNVKTGDMEYEEREIQVGLETDDRVEVVSGITANDEILLPSSE